VVRKENRPPEFKIQWHAVSKRSFFYSGRGERGVQSTECMAVNTGGGKSIMDVCVWNEGSAMRSNEREGVMQRMEKELSSCRGKTRDMNTRGAGTYLTCSFLHLFYAARSTLLLQARCRAEVGRRGEIQQYLCIIARETHYQSTRQCKGRCFPNMRHMWLLFLMLRQAAATRAPNPVPVTIFDAVEGFDCNANYFPIQVLLDGDDEFYSLKEIDFATGGPPPPPSIYIIKFI
jgi:hypothetical protein